MALRITKAADPIKVERLNVVIYAQPGIGKTSVAFTAHNPLLLDFDNGSYRAVNRKDTVQINSWEDVAGITAEDLEPYSTVVMDTAGRALDVLTEHLLRNPKNAVKGGGKLSIQGYGALKSEFTGFCKRLNQFGKDVILVAHMDEQKDGDEIRERLDVTGGSKGEIYKTADMMGRLVMVNGKRELRFSPSDTAFGKNPGQLEPVAVPDHTDPAYADLMAGILNRTKERLNDLTEAQREAMEEQNWFREALPKVEDVDGINGLLDRAKAGGTACKALVANRAKLLGLIFDQKAGQYVMPEIEDGDREAA